MTDTEDTGTTIASDIVPAPARAGLSKSATIQKLLGRAKGATMAEMITVTQWQPHSCRAFLTGLRKKGVTLVKEARGTGDSCWRIQR